MLTEISKDMEEFIKREALNKLSYEVALMRKEVNKCIEKAEFDLRHTTLV